MGDVTNHENGEQTMTTIDAPAEQAIDRDDAAADAAAEDAEIAEVVTRGEIVKHEPIDAAADAALEAAANAALMMPGVAGRDEFLSLAMQARVLSLSGAAPKIVQQNPHVALHVAMVGRDLGISPSAALELIDVLDTAQGPRLSLSPQLLNGQIRRLGLGSIIPVVRDAAMCVAAALAPGGEYDVRCRADYPRHVEDCRCKLVLGVSEFTWDMARMAMLVGRDCAPGSHSEACRGSGSVSRGVRCAFGYKTYPDRMMWWRASGFAADDYFPEAGLGLYTAEELGAVVDAEGRPIDVTSVELPPGYEVAAIAKGAPGAGGDDPCETVDAAWMQAVLQGVDPETKAKLKAPWVNSVGMLKPEDVSVRQARGAKALLRGMVHDVDAVAETGALRISTAMVACSPWCVVELTDGPDPDGSPDRPGSPEGDGDADPAPDGAETQETATQAISAPIETTAVEATPAPKDVADDPLAPVAVEFVRAAHEEATGAGWPAERIESTASEVRNLHHAKVNAELTAYGQEVDGLHIDTRRMFLVGYRIDRMLRLDEHNRDEHADDDPAPGCPACEPQNAPSS